MGRFEGLRRGLDRRGFGRAGFGAFAGLVATSTQAAESGNAQPAAHQAVFQVSTDDRRTQALILGNVHNYAKYYKAKGEQFALEIVAFGPGFSMLRADLSMMKGELANLQEELGSALTVSACDNTRSAVAESEGKKPDDIPLLPGVKDTPSGVVRLAELQGQGWAYLRP